MGEKLFWNGNIITVSESSPYANYILVKDGMIEDVGIATNDTIKSRFKDIESINLNGDYVVPGFIDSHMHMLTGALTKLQVDLNDKKFQSVIEMLEYIAQNSITKEGWVRAFGLDEDNLKEKRLPTAKEISVVFGDRPVIITRVCGHVSIVNEKALELMDNDEISNIVGGEFKKNEEGLYTGIVTELAQQYVLDKIPTNDSSVIFDILENEQKELIEKGICSIHDAGTDQIESNEYLELYKKFNEEGRLKIRTYLMARPIKGMEFQDFAEYIKELMKTYPIEKSRLFFGTVKLFADGSLGGKTAAVYDGYVGDKDNKGLLLKEILDEYIVKVHNAGLKLAIHAIGDRSTEYVVDSIINANLNNPKDIRHRVEHAELLNMGIINKIAENNISIMTQPRFITEFGKTYIKNLGQDRAQWIQPIKTMIEKGINVGFGTDYPVIDGNPLKGIDSAVKREIEKGLVLNKEEAIKFNDALRCYTLENAYGADSERYQGSLEKGKFADFVILNRRKKDDLTSLMCSLEVKKTIIAGEILYESEGE